MKQLTLTDLAGVLGVGVLFGSPNAVAGPRR